MSTLQLVAAVALGYVLGAIPSGVLVGRLRGVDPRDAGSGRTGTTNAYRTMGMRWAALVAVLDVAKGVAAVLLGNLIGPGPWAGALAGVAAVVGHVRSVFIGFEGGRGVATGAGVMILLAPLAVLAAIVEFAVVVGATRYVSLGSILGSITVAIISVVLAAVGWAGIEVAVAGCAIAAIVVVSHADNIERLRAGTERRFGSG
ncbi:MAG TPA: glycerol-3-phosphate 1-O-acyltransferase PlsY [Candidatus Limnocylindria bacterium]|nr:glycerol-3-phosphate 1-O-acyltransferase PlsY [Candidatus Limnocylindria bacterium]